MNKFIFELCICMALLLTGCGKDAKPINSMPSSASSESEAANTVQTGGAMSPEDALKYMKATSNLVIVDVAAAKWYDKNHFKGAVNIPIEELSNEEEDALYMKIPADRPVLLHCRRGMIVPGAYERVRELRPNISEISYIDGVPPFDEYNSWLSDK